MTKKKDKVIYAMLNLYVNYKESSRKDQTKGQTASAEHFAYVLHRMKDILFDVMDMGNTRGKDIILDQGS